MQAGGSSRTRQQPQVKSPRTRNDVTSYISSPSESIRSTKHPKETAYGEIYKLDSGRSRREEADGTIMTSASPRRSDRGRRGSSVVKEASEPFAPKLENNQSSPVRRSGRGSSQPARNSKNDEESTKQSTSATLQDSPRRTPRTKQQRYQQQHFFADAFSDDGKTGMGEDHRDEVQNYLASRIRNHMRDPSVGGDSDDERRDPPDDKSTRQKPHITIEDENGTSTEGQGVPAIAQTSRLPAFGSPFASPSSMGSQSQRPSSTTSRNSTGSSTKKYIGVQEMIQNSMERARREAAARVAATAVSLTSEGDSDPEVVQYNKPDSQRKRDASPRLTGALNWQPIIAESEEGPHQYQHFPSSVGGEDRNSDTVSTAEWSEPSVLTEASGWEAGQKSLEIQRPPALQVQQDLDMANRYDIDRQSPLQRARNQLLQLSPSERRYRSTAPEISSRMKLPPTQNRKIARQGRQFKALRPKFPILTADSIPEEDEKLQEIDDATSDMIEALRCQISPHSAASAKSTTSLKSRSKLSVCRKLEEEKRQEDRTETQEYNPENEESSEYDPEVVRMQKTIEADIPNRIEQDYHLKTKEDNTTGDSEVDGNETKEKEPEIPGISSKDSQDHGDAEDCISTMDIRQMSPEDIENLVTVSMTKAQRNAQIEVQKMLQGSRRRMNKIVVKTSEGDKALTKNEIGELVKESMTKARHAAQQEITNMIRDSVRRAQESAKQEIRDMMHESMQRARESAKKEMESIVRESLQKARYTDSSVEANSTMTSTQSRELSNVSLTATPMPPTSNLSVLKKSNEESAEKVEVDCLVKEQFASQSHDKIIGPECPVDGHEANPSPQDQKTKLEGDTSSLVSEHERTLAEPRTDSLDDVGQNQSTSISPDAPEEGAFVTPDSSRVMASPREEIRAEHKVETVTSKESTLVDGGTLQDKEGNSDSYSELQSQDGSQKVNEAKDPVAVTHKPVEQDLVTPNLETQEQWSGSDDKGLGDAIKRKLMKPPQDSLSFGSTDVKSGSSLSHADSRRSTDESYRGNSYVNHNLTSETAINRKSSRISLVSSEEKSLRYIASRVVSSRDSILGRDSNGGVEAVVADESLNRNGSTDKFRCGQSHSLQDDWSGVVNNSVTEEAEKSCGSLDENSIKAMSDEMSVSALDTRYGCGVNLMGMFGINQDQAETFDTADSANEPETAKTPRGRSTMAERHERQRQRQPLPAPIGLFSPASRWIDTIAQDFSSALGESSAEFEDNEAVYSTFDEHEDTDDSSVRHRRHHHTFSTSASVSEDEDDDDDRSHSDDDSITDNEGEEDSFNADWWVEKKTRWRKRMYQRLQKDT